MRTLIATLPLFAFLVLLPACGNDAADEGGGGGAAPSGKFKVKFETTKGDIVFEIVPDWAPIGARHFHKLVEAGFFTDVAFFRVVKGFMAQFGISGDPAMNRKWLNSTITDDPVGSASNTAGYLTYAMGGRNTRSTQLFINMANNSGLDRQGFPPIGRVVEGMSVVLSLYAGYGDSRSAGGRGPEQGVVAARGNAFLRKNYPKLDYIKRATIVR